MSDELRLPDDLAALEARLAAHALPPSGVNRDELMYRAGWAAAEASRSEAGRAVAASSLSHPPRQARSVAAWSLSSAALAASLAVIVTLAMQSPRGKQMASLPEGGVAPIAVVDAAHEPPAPSSDVADYLAVVGDAGAGRLGAPLLALYRRSAESAVNPLVAEAAVNDASLPPAKTARELLQEFLPTRDSSPAVGNPPLRIWPWSAPSTGESI